MNPQLLLYIAIGLGAFGVVLALISIDVARRRLSADDYNELVDYIDDKTKDAVSEIDDKLKAATAKKKEEKPAEAAPKASQRRQEEYFHQQPQPAYQPQQQPVYHQPRPIYQPQQQAPAFAPVPQQPEQQRPVGDITIGFFAMNNGDSFTAISDMPAADTLFRVNFGGSRNQANGTFEFTGTIEQLRSLADNIVGSAVTLINGGADLSNATRYITAYKGSVARMNNQWTIITPVVLQLGR